MQIKLKRYQVMFILRLLAGALYSSDSKSDFEQERK